MTKSTILLVDDEPQVLNAVMRDVRGRYGAEYRVMAAGSGPEALDLTAQLKARGAPLALFLVDQRMPGMSGTEFLAAAQQHYPQARRVLLTAYADTEVAIASINAIGLDHYLLKPWDPPQEKLFPVLDDLLAEWQRSADLPYDGIRVAGTLWSPPSHAVKDFLTRNQIPYRWLDIELDASARALVDAAAPGDHRLPVVFFPDGTTLVAPEPRALAEQVGLQTQASRPYYDLIIIGAGPAGLGAAVYGGSEGLSTCMIEKQATGGQAGTSSRIENYLGFPNGLSGAELAQRATIQARRFGVEILTAQEATAIRADDPYRIVTLADGTELSCRALVIATGVTTRKLDVPGCIDHAGAGVYYGATLSEAAHYVGQDVFLVGGANSAGQAAVFFARYARQVTLLVRGDSLSKSMSDYLIRQIESIPNIAVRTHTVVTSVHGGSDGIAALTLHDTARDATDTVPAAALFIFIGAEPHTDLVAGVVERNPQGFILTGPDLQRDGQPPRGWTLKRDPLLLETSVPGIFAAGDVRHGSIKRVASAVGEGAVAVSLVHQYLRTV